MSVHSRTIACIVVAVAIATTVACTMPKRISTLDAPQENGAVDGVRVPLGIFVAPGSRTHVQIGGLYPTPAQEPLCCWLAPVATVVAVKTQPATVGIVSVLYPPFPFFVKGGQSVSVSVAGMTKRFEGLGPGVHQLAIELPNALRAYVGHVAFTIRSQRVFVPVREGLNADTRKLGTVLEGISFQP